MNSSSRDHDHTVIGGDGSPPVPSGPFAHDCHVGARMFYVPLETLTAPVGGEVICDAWWLVHPQHGAAFYYRPFGYLRSEEPSPQCNRNESITRHLNRAHLDVVQVSAAFMSHARRAMVRDKAFLASIRDGVGTDPRPPVNASQVPGMTPNSTPEGR